MKDSIKRILAGLIDFYIICFLCFTKSPPFLYNTTTNPKSKSAQYKSPFLTNNTITICNFKERKIYESNRNRAPN